MFTLENGNEESLPSNIHLGEGIPKSLTRQIGLALHSLPSVQQLSEAL